MLRTAHQPFLSPRSPPPVAPPNEAEVQVKAERAFCHLELLAEAQKIASFARRSSWPDVDLSLFTRGDITNRLAEIAPNQETQIKAARVLLQPFQKEQEHEIKDIPFPPQDMIFLKKLAGRVFIEETRKRSMAGHPLYDLPCVIPAKRGFELVANRAVYNFHDKHSSDIKLQDFFSLNGALDFFALDPQSVQGNIHLINILFNRMTKESPQTPIEEICLVFPFYR